VGNVVSSGHPRFVAVRNTNRNKRFPAAAEIGTKTLSRQKFCRRRVLERISAAAGD
jgi:hypothetical protein